MLTQHYFCHCSYYLLVVEAEYALEDEDVGAVHGHRPLLAAVRHEVVDRHVNLLAILQSLHKKNYMLSHFFVNLSTNSLKQKWGLHWLVFANLKNMNLISQPMPREVDSKHLCGLPDTLYLPW